MNLSLSVFFSGNTLSPICFLHYYPISVSLPYFRDDFSLYNTFFPRCFLSPRHHDLSRCNLLSLHDLSHCNIFSSRDLNHRDLLSPFDLNCYDIFHLSNLNISRSQPPRSPLFGVESEMAMAFGGLVRSSSSNQ